MRSSRVVAVLLGLLVVALIGAEAARAPASALAPAQQQLRRPPPQQQQQGHDKELNNRPIIGVLTQVCVWGGALSARCQHARHATAGRVLSAFRG